MITRRDFTKGIVGSAVLLALNANSQEKEEKPGIGYDKENGVMRMYEFPLPKHYVDVIRTEVDEKEGYIITTYYPKKEQNKLRERYDEGERTLENYPRKNCTTNLMKKGNGMIISTKYPVQIEIKIANLYEKTREDAELNLDDII